jgi:hypothetical protein
VLCILKQVARVVAAVFENVKPHGPLTVAFLTWGLLSSRKIILHSSLSIHILRFSRIISGTPTIRLVLFLSPLAVGIKFHMLSGHSAFFHSFMYFAILLSQETAVNISNI